jgi:hypothetical protein
MGATRRNLQAQLKNIIGTPNIPNIVLKSENQQKIRVEATRRNLQALPKMLKKIVGTSNNQNKNFPN